MKKITSRLLYLVAMVLTSYSATAQFGCESAVVITDGYTAMGITTPGTGGPEDWNTTPTGTSISASYWKDDAYAFVYTAGATAEAIEMVTFSRQSWNGIGIFSTCTGTTFSGELDAVGTTGSNTTKTVSAMLNPGQTVYIITGQWGTPNALDFDVVSFSATAITEAPDCVAITSPVDAAVGVNVEGVFTWASSPTATGYYLSLGTTPGGTDVLNLVDVGSALTYDIPGYLASNTMHYLTVIPYNSVGPATNCTEISFTTSTPPANDNCAGAVSLIVNADLACTAVTSGTNVNASSSMAASPCFGNPNDDVWFSFIATSTTHTVTLSNIVAVSGTSTDMYFQVLSGTCGDFTSVLCSDPNTNTLNGLTVGNTYYVRVYSYYATARQTFDICIGTPPPPPPAPDNDDCADAISLTVNPDYSCTAVTPGTTQSATQSSQATTCSGTPNDDVWFSFEATSTAHRVSLTDVVAVTGTSTDMYMQIVSGTCAELTSVLCSDANTANLTGLTIGSVYYVRVYSYGTTSRQTFNICVGTPPPPPANDSFAAAIPVSCGNLYSGNTTTATLDENDAPDGFGSDMDSPNVWYSFTGDGSPQTVTLNLCTSSYDTSVLVYTGTSGNLTLVAANEDDAACGSGATTRSRVRFNSDGVTTYFIAVEGYGSTNVGAFDMDVTCAVTIPPAVENQACVSAEEVFVNGVAVSSENTNGTVNMVQPSCDAYNNIQDVWFSFVAPASGDVTIQVTNGTMTSANFNVYSGICDTLVPVTGSCNSNFTTSSTEALTGLTADATYFVQVWSNAAEEGSFTLTLTNPALSTADFNNASFRYYPNPVKDVLTISNKAVISNVAVFNLLGQQVLNHTNNSTEATVDMQQFPSGAYIVKATAEGLTQSFKIIKE